MNKNILLLGFFAATLAACNGDNLGSGAQADTVVLDVRCAADADCPSGFQCEVEVEHGVETSYCVSDDEQGTSTGECPAGYEQEIEHGGTFCKPHGGDDNGGSGGSGGDDNSGKGGAGGDDNGGNGGAGGDDGSGGGAAEGEACATNADCAAGLECEVQVENGVTTSVCKAHGGN